MLPCSFKLNFASQTRLFFSRHDPAARACDAAGLVFPTLRAAIVDVQCSPLVTAGVHECGVPRGGSSREARGRPSLCAR